MRFIPRKHLPHDVPAWVSDGSLFFITIHGAKRGTNDLIQSEAADALLESAAFYHCEERWFARLFLLMPDHVHALLAFPRAETMRDVVAAWKRYTARQAGISWQPGFFEHRIRGGENWQLKADYIRANPVRKGLVTRTEDWPWVFEA